MKNGTAQRFTPHPVITTSERPCSFCPRTYRHPWGWILVLPQMIVVDLCPRCSRVVRYGTADEVSALMKSVAAHLSAGKEVAA